MGQLPVTTRMALPCPDENNPADVPTDIDKLRKRIDELSAIYLQGALSTRPAAAIPGRLFFATDERRMWYDDGSIWNSPYNPPGSLMPFAAATAPVGWLLCDGAAYPRAEYSALFAAISTTWGAGDGTSTFNVPDLRGRAPVGSGTGTGLTARSLGGKGGEEAHALSVAEMPAHAHEMNAAAGGGSNLSSDAIPPNNGVYGGRNMTTTYAGATGPHNNMQPFAVVNYLIKT